METYFNNLSAEEGTKEKLFQDLTTLLHDTEDLVKATRENWSKKTQEELKAAAARIKTGCEQIQKRATACAQVTDQNIRRYPYPWISIAFGLGLLTGLVVNRR